MKVDVPAEFSPSELSRYSRHFSLPQVGLEGQAKLKAAKVLCLGAGGLGSPALNYLAAAGIGTLGIVDGDVVELSNLQRQTLFNTQDLHRSKALVAKEKLASLNPDIQIIAHPVFLSTDNAFEIIKDYDLVIDGSDNYATRYLVNDVCYLLNKPYIFASIFQFEGQCSIFIPNETPCYRCLYQEPPPAMLVPNCAEGGVLGVLPGLFGVIQATEAIKFILQLGQSLANKLLLCNALSFDFRQLHLQKNPACILCGQEKRSFAQLPRYNQTVCDAVEENVIAPQQLRQLIQQSVPLKLLDVREIYEYEICHLNAHLIPLAQLPQRYQELNPEDFIVVYCKVGMRSLQAVNFLKAQGFKNVVNLTGGILAWIKQIDQGMRSY